MARRKITSSLILVLFLSLCFANLTLNAQGGGIVGEIEAENGTFNAEKVNFKFTRVSPNFHPSSMRGAVEAISGSEAKGVNNRDSGVLGHTISGVVSGPAGLEAANAFSVTLYHLPAGTIAGSISVQAGSNKVFAFQNQPDGEYLIIARTDNEVNNLASAQMRVTLKGKDLTGLELKLLPLGSISGRIVVEKAAAACDENRQPRLEEFAVSAVRDDLPRDGSGFTPSRSFSMPGANEKGEFKIDSIDPGHYRIRMPLNDGNLFVKAITSPTNTQSRKGGAPANNNVSSNGIALKQGEKVNSVMVTIAEGAASLSGKIVIGKEGDRLPERLRAHLVPAEANAADDVLRYAEAIVTPDGAFAFNNIAPGKYRLIKRVASRDEASNRQAAPTAWDANERAKLRRESMAAKYEIELQPCGRIKDYVLQLNN